MIFSTHNIAEAERYGERLLVLADGELLFDGTVAELHEAEPVAEGARPSATSSAPSSTSSRSRGH